MSSILAKTIGLVESTDTGYQAVCPICAIRFDEVARMVGEPREIRIEQCHPCATAPVLVMYRDRRLYRKNRRLRPSEIDTTMGGKDK